jgi:hypothetical protein
MNRQLPARIHRDHPLVLREYAVYTPPIDEMIQTIRGWIDQRVPGGYIYGASRFGKSRGIKFFIREELAATFDGPVPLVVWVRSADTHKSESGFWNELLYYSGFAFLKRDRPHPAATGRHLVTERFATIATQARANYIVLIIDEAQQVSAQEWQWLTGLQNRLDWLGYRLSVFSIATEQMKYQHDFMAKSGNAHIQARFLVEHARFHGLRSVEDLAYVLNGYDLDSEWPKGSGITFHQFYSPEGFARGERLADTADAMWTAMHELAPQVSEFPMQHIAVAVESTLNELAMESDWSGLTSKSGWEKTLEKTSLARHMKIVFTAT